MAKFNLEDAIKELEEITERLSGGQISLEESLQLFKRGNKLAAQCRIQLTKYAKQIKILTENNELADFDEKED